jgi:hypothetical protein
MNSLPAESRSLRRSRRLAAVLVLVGTAGLVVRPAAAQTLLRLSPMPAAAARSDLGSSTSPYDEAQAMKAAGIAQTAVVHIFSDHRAAALGFLCGLQPSAQTTGGAGVFGVDPHGRFVGAQLRFGFR